MQPAKRQKLEVEPREDAQLNADNTSTQYAAPILSQAFLEQAAPAPSGTLHPNPKLEPLH